MIKFFRKVRQKLISENNFSKYLLYAIGEIVLVVIGILIALYINNQNELKKNKTNFIANLKQVHLELGKNIKRADEMAVHYKAKDLAIYNIMMDKTSKKDINRDYDKEIIYNEVMVIKDQGYENLVRNLGEIPQDYNSLVFELKELYSKNKADIQYINNIMDKTTLDYEEWLSLNTTWYKEDYFNNTDLISISQIEFYRSENSIFKNFVNKYYKLGVHGHYSNIMTFRYLANRAYNDISKKLELNNTESFSFHFTDSEKQLITGEYTSGDNVVHIIEKDNMFYLLSDSNGEEQIFFIDNNTFIIDRIESWGFRSLTFDSNKNVIGFTIKKGANKFQWIKK